MENSLKKNLPLQAAKNPYVQFIALGVVLLLLIPLVKGSTISILGNVVIMSIVGIGYNILLGYSGQISLGTAGFMGLAAYTTVIAIDDFHLPFIIALILAIALPLIMGVIVGALALKISGNLLAIATLCVAEILRRSFEDLKITGGFSGRNLRTRALFGIPLDRTMTYVLLVVVLIIVMILTYNIVNSRLGRAFHALRGSWASAQAMGINLNLYRLISFALSTAYAGVAGCLYLFFIKFVFPSNWIMGISLFILASVVIGGIRSSWGTLVGTFIIFAMPDLVLKRIPVISQIPGFSYIFDGILIAVVMLFMPNGVVYLITTLFYKLKTKKVRK